MNTGNSSPEVNRHSQYPKVSIIILNWNGITDTAECLESLKKITYPNYEVIIVDNASEGDDVKVLTEKYGDYVRVIESEQRYNIRQAKNIGIRYVMRKGTGYIQFLDNDMTVAPDFLSQLVEVMQSDPKMGIAGSKTYNYYEPRRLSDVGGFMNFWTGFMHHVGTDEVDQGQLRGITDIGYVTPSCMLISVDAILSAGLWDEKLKLWYDDVDLCTRVAKAGFRIVLVPSSAAWHKERSLYLNRAKKPMRITAYYHARDRLRCMRKHCNKLQFITSTLCFIGVELPSLIVKYLGNRYYFLRKRRSVDT